MNRRERTLLIAVGTIGVLLLFYFYIYSPRQAEYRRLQATLETQQTQLARMEATARQITRLREEFTRLQAFIADIEAKLPAQKEMPALLVQLERLTRSLAVNLLSIRPGQLQAVQAAAPPPAPGTRPPAPGAPAPAPAAPGPTYLRFPIGITVEATYDEVVRLTKELMDFPRMIAIRNIALQPRTIPKLTIAIDVETYVLPREAR